MHGCSIVGCGLFEGLDLPVGFQGCLINSVPRREVAALATAFMRVDRVLHVSPTRRWPDYYVKFGEVDSDSIIVFGEGATYGDQRMGWKFDWSGNGHHEVAWPTVTHSKAMSGE